MKNTSKAARNNKQYVAKSRTDWHGRPFVMETINPSRFKQGHVAKLVATKSRDSPLTRFAPKSLELTQDSRNHVTHPK